MYKAKSSQENQLLSMQTYYVPEASVNVAPQTSRRRPVRVRKPPMDSLNFTYHQLKQHLQNHVGNGARAPVSSLPNLISAISAFQIERQLPDGEVIGSTLRASYHRNLTAHVNSLREQGRSAAYIANRKSLLARWRRELVDADQVSAASHARQPPFQAAVIQLFEQTGAKYKATATTTGLPLATLKRWLDGVTPNARSLRWVPQLERHFGLPHGALMDLLPVRARGSDDAVVPRRVIAYRTRLAQAIRVRYAVKEVNERLRQEWSDYVAYKVAIGSSARRKLRRPKSGRWSMSTALEQGRVLPWFALHCGHRVPTADVTWNFVSQYFGWLQLDVASGGKGMPPDEAQTLANFARDDLLENYIDWRIRRSNGIHHGGITKILQLAASLTHPDMGYLTQSFRLFEQHCFANDAAEWLESCQATYEFAREKMAERSDEAYQPREDGVQGDTSRSSFEPIAAALSLPNPLDAVADAVSRLRANRPSTNGEDEALWARDLLLLKLFASNPLRAKNMMELTYSPDNTGKLRKVNGQWRIAVPRREFKNFAGAARERDYDMPVRPEVWHDIERYLHDFRPMLADPGNPFVFVAARSPTKMLRSINRRIETLTRQYLSGCPGAGPHSFRHIVATSILKANPNAWTLAAMVLHDREETVRKHYAHLRCDDAYRMLDATLASSYQRMQ